MLPPRREERQVRITIFFAAFASLRREIFRIFGCGFAALGLCGESFFTPVIDSHVSFTPLYGAEVTPVNTCASRKGFLGPAVRAPPYGPRFKVQ